MIFTMRIFMITFAFLYLTAVQTHAAESDTVYSPKIAMLLACNEHVDDEPEEVTHEYSDIEITETEYTELCQIVAAEAQTQCLEGQKAVVEVIFNRVLSSKFPNTVHDVLSQKGQFTTWKMRNYSWVEPDLVKEAVDSVISDGRQVLDDTEYVYFSRGRSSYGKDWIKLQDHWFGRINW